MNPARVLFRTFFSQFFVSETVTSEIQMRQTIIWVLAFLIAPLLILMVEVFPHFQFVAIRAVRFHDTELLTDTIEWIEFLMITHTMITVGLIAVFVWDALTFDRRDAMVLGPLPLSSITVGGAKLAALGAFLLGASALVNAPSGLLFAMETSDQFGARVFLTHLFAHFGATMSAAAFTFAAIVALRGVVVLAFGARVASALGPIMQFAFIVLILTFVILTPAVWKVPHAALVNPAVTGWLPGSWFLGMFEQLRGSSRPYFIPLAARALRWLPLTLGAAILVSILTFRRQMRLALAPASTPGTVGLSPIVAWLARCLAGHDPAARASADFVVMTLARNRHQQGPLAMTTAIGAAIVLGALVQRAGTIHTLMRPRTLILWIPLVVSYWTVIGLRAAFSLPSELRAAVTFAVNGPRGTRAYWSGVRAAAIACLAAPVTLLTLITTGPLIGWRTAAWHTAFVAGMVTTIVELAVMSLDAVPFTRPYAAGDAKLRMRWPLYFFGMYLFAYWPVQLELRLLNGRDEWLIALAAFAAAAAHAVGRRRARRWTVDLVEDIGDEGRTIAVLDLGSFVPHPSVRAHSGA